MILHVTKLKAPQPQRYTEHPFTHHLPSAAQSSENGAAGP